MKIYNCDSDIGSVLVGNETVRFALPNIGGDGTTECYVFDDEFELSKCETESGIHFDFVTCIEGTFCIFNYDCSDGSPEDAVAELTGRYGVYKGIMKVALVRWN